MCARVASLAVDLIKEHPLNICYFIENATFELKLYVVERNPLLLNGTGCIRRNLSATQVAKLEEVALKAKAFYDNIADAILGRMNGSKTIMEPPTSPVPGKQTLRNVSHNATCSNRANALGICCFSDVTLCEYGKGDTKEGMSDILEIIRLNPGYVAHSRFTDSFLEALRKEFLPRLPREEANGVESYTRRRSSSESWTQNSLYQVGVALSTNGPSGNSFHIL
jgi:hypothetical protein